jgi:hypothetical protein
MSAKKSGKETSLTSNPFPKYTYAFCGSATSAATAMAGSATSTPK